MKGRGRVGDSITHEVLTEVEYARKHLVGETVLDVACGIGRHGHLLEFYGFDVTYLDVDDVVDKQDKIIEDFLHYDEEGRWDNVVSFQFLEHLKPNELTEVLEKMKKLSKHRVVNITPHIKHSEYKEEPTHRLYYSPKKLVEAHKKVFGNAEMSIFDNKSRKSPLSWPIEFVKLFVNRYNFSNVLISSETEEEVEK